MLRRLILAAWALLASACHIQEKPPAFAEAMTLGGVLIPAETLNAGHSFFALHCAACHGPDGSGRGPVGVQQIPAPRDLRLGILKYGSVPAGALPTDADLHHLLLTGLRGTGMQPWRFRDQEINAAAQYIKTLSPRWQTEKAGEPIAPQPDPYKAATPEVVARGAAIYHGAAANCMACHPRYDTSVAAVRAGPEKAVATDSVFGQLTAPDLRTAVRRTGDTPDDVYKVIAAGIGGTGMVPMQGRLSGDEMWALTYYILSLQPGKR